MQGGAIHSLSGIKFPPNSSIRSSIPLDGLLLAYLYTMFWLSYYKTMQNLYKNWLLVSKIIWGIWITSDKQWKVQKVVIQWDTFVRKIRSFSKTTFVKIHQVLYICHFWNNVIFHNTTRLHYFSSNITYFWQKYPIKAQTFRFFAAPVKMHEISQVIFQTKSESWKFGSLFSFMRDNSSAFILAEK